MISRDGNFVLWKSGKFCATGVYGRLVLPLGEIAARYKETPDIEFAEPLNQGSREFLAGFNFTPPIDITLVKGANNTASIVNYSVDERAAMLFTQDLIRRIGFIQGPPALDFMVTIDAETILHSEIYELCRAIAAGTDSSLRDVFGAVTYTNFCRAYKGLSEEESMRRACKRFKIPGIS